MSIWIRFLSCALAVWFGIMLGGCSPDQGRMDDEKEPHFVLGKSRVNAMDYQGAIEAYEESLEANPRSAAAHFELGWLYDQKVRDPAAAIYHYEQYLKRDPNAGNADVIRGRVDACKQELTLSVMALPSTSAAQQQLEKLVEQNRQLQAQVDHLNEVVKLWNAYYASQLTAAKSNEPAQNISADVQQTPNPTQPTQHVSPQPNNPTATRSATVTRATSATPRTRTVVPGETAAAIARKAGITLDTLRAANPGVNLSRIRAGQVLKLPPP